MKHALMQMQYRFAVIYETPSYDHVFYYRTIRRSRKNRRQPAVSEISARGDRRAQHLGENLTRQMFVLQETWYLY